MSFFKILDRCKTAEDFDDVAYFLSSFKLLMDEIEPGCQLPTLDETIDLASLAGNRINMKIELNSDGEKSEFEDRKD